MATIYRVLKLASPTMSSISSDVLSQLCDRFMTVIHSLRQGSFAVYPCPMTLPDAPPLSALLEAALYAEDLDLAEEFYGTTLGLPEVTRAEGRHIFYRVGQTILLIFNPKATQKGSSNARMPVPAHGATGPGHLCFAASREEITKWKQRLEAAGHPAEVEFDWPNGAHSLYFRDPAGNSLEIAEPGLWF